MTRLSGQPPCYGLSPAQEWMLTVERLRFARGLQLTWVARLPDGVDEQDATRRAARLFRRETAMRTCITRRDGVFVQQIMPAGDPPLACDKADTMADATALLGEIMTAEAADPVDPRRRPARARLFSVGPRLRFLILTAHHAIADWWAMELAASQVGELRQEDGEPRPDGMTFAAYADLLARRSGQSEAQWAEVLAGAAPSVPPADYPVPASGATTSKAIVDSGMADSDVRQMAAQARATPFAVLLTAFAVVLRIRTRRDDVMVCTQLTNRGRPELARLVGCLTTTVPLRLDASGDRSFADLTSAAQRALAMAYRYGNVNFGRVMSAYAPSLGADQRTMPSVLFQMIPRAPGQARPVPPDLAAVARPGAGLPVDLHVAVSMAEQRLRCEADFNDRLYRQDTVAGLLGEFSHVLRTARTSMAASVSSVCEKAAADG